MVKYSTETGRTLVPENHYVAMINDVKEKTVKQYVLYEWSFESDDNGKPFYFGLTMFSSQMAELLRALGCSETTPNKFEWDSDAVIGNTVEFNVCHVADKKGVIREQISDIKLLSTKPKERKATTDEEIAWDTELDKK